MNELNQCVRDSSAKYCIIAQHHHLKSPCGQIIASYSSNASHLNLWLIQTLSTISCSTISHNLLAGRHLLILWSSFSLPDKSIVYLDKVSRRQQLALSDTVESAILVLTLYISPIMHRITLFCVYIDTMSEYSLQFYSCFYFVYLFHSTTVLF